MSSKKHSKRDNSSSSSEESDSSTDRRKKHSRRHHSESDEDGKPNSKSRARKSSSVERGSSRYRRGRSRSSDKNPRSKDKSRSRSRHRSRSREYRRDRDKVNKSSSSRFDHRKDFRNRRSDNLRRNDRQRRSRSRSFDHANAKWGKHDDQSEDRDKKKNMENNAKPNFALSGKLTEETNTYKGIVIKYSEPPEARKPRRRWRLYPFKGEKAMQTLYIHRESAYLIGRERKVVDLAVDHPSCSKQHAALQYRLVPFTRDNGTVGKRVRPYLIDLESANGTFINNKKIEPRKYVELLEKDVIKFGFSSREYVLLHENSKDEAMDDDVNLEDDIKAEVNVKEERE